MRRKLLDLYCRAGGAGAGYAAAGFDIVGVDIVDKSDVYPGEFILSDAITFVRQYGRLFDCIHASPPCQASCALTVGTNDSAGWSGSYVDLVAPTRDAIESTDRPYVIEQPAGRAPIRRDVMLCGEMFRLGVLRHRYFELGGWGMKKPHHPTHRGYTRGWRHGVYRDGPYVAAYGEGGGKASIKEMQDAMRIPWMNDRIDLTEAIPPAYTECIGKAWAR